MPLNFFQWRLLSGAVWTQFSGSAWFLSKMGETHWGPRFITYMLSCFWSYCNSWSFRSDWLCKCSKESGIKKMNRRNWSGENGPKKGDPRKWTQESGPKLFLGQEVMPPPNLLQEIQPLNWDHQTSLNFWGFYRFHPCSYQAIRER